MSLFPLVIAFNFPSSHRGAGLPHVFRVGFHCCRWARYVGSSVSCVDYGTDASAADQHLNQGEYIALNVYRTDQAHVVCFLVLRLGNLCDPFLRPFLDARG